MRLLLVLLFAATVVSGLSPDDATSLSFELNTASARAWVSPSFVGITLSFMTGAGDPLWNGTSIVSEMDLEDPQLRRLVSELAPGVLRVGGGAECGVTMQVHEGECAKAHTKPGFCLTMPRWEKILDFAAKTGVKMVWGLGAQHRSSSFSPLDFSNIQEFIAFTANLSRASDGAVTQGLLGWELGNELDGGDYKSGVQVVPEVLADDYCTLAKIIRTEYANTANVPKLVGPAMHNVVNFAARFLGRIARDCPDTLDIFTLHDYVGYGLDPQLRQKIVTPAWLDSYWDAVSAIVQTARAVAPTAEIWIGETSAAWHSGQCGVTDRFASNFWYANALGSMAKHGVAAVARHSFNGGCYPMINKTAEWLRPNPDYWLALVWRRLMGTSALDIRDVTGTTDTGLRFYAMTSLRFPPSAASNGGSGAVVVFINPTSTPRCIEFTAAKGLNTPRYEYTLTGGQASDPLSSDTVLINGSPLHLDPTDGSLPDGAVWPTQYAMLVNGTAPCISVDALSIKFVELPEATVY